MPNSLLTIAAIHAAQLNYQYKTTKIYRLLFKIYMHIADIYRQINRIYRPSITLTPCKCIFSIAARNCTKGNSFSLQNTKRESTMKSKFTLLKTLSIVLAVSLLHACGGGGSSSTTPASTAATTGTVTYWTKNSTYVPISFTFDGVAAGTLSYSKLTAPTCGNAGAYGLTKVLTLGVHPKVATSSKGTWPASVTVNSGCTLIELI